MVRQAQRLVVQILVHIGLRGDELSDLVLPPDRPVMADEHDVGVRAEAVDRLVQALRPAQRVANLRTTQRVQVVHHVVDDLRHAQRSAARQVEYQLGGRLSIGRVLEDDLQTVDRQGLTAGVNDHAGRHERRNACSDGHPEPGTDLASRPARQHRTEHEHRAAQHRIARVHVLADRLVHESVGCDDRNRGGIIHTTDLEYAPYSAEMVGMAVRVDDSGQRQFTELGVHQPHSGPRAGNSRERIDDEVPRVGAQNRHVRDVEAADLIDALAHFEEAGILPIELRDPPKARVHLVRSGTGEELVWLERPRDSAVRPFDAHRRRCGEETPQHCLLLRILIEWQLVGSSLIDRSSRGARSSERIGHSSPSGRANTARTYGCSP